MIPGAPTAASPEGGAPPSPWLARGQGAALALAWSLGVGAAVAYPPHWPWPGWGGPLLAGLGVLGSWVGATWWAAHGRRQAEAQWRKLAWLGLRGGVAPPSQVGLGGPSGWAIEACHQHLEGPGAAWADLRQGPGEASLTWLVAAMPASEGGLPALVRRASASAKWAAIGPESSLDQALEEVAIAAGASEAWAAWAAALDAHSGALTFAGLGGMVAFTVDRRGRLGYLWGSLALDAHLPLEGALGPGQARLAEGSALLVLDALALTAPGPMGESFGLGRLERLIRERPGCDAQALCQMVAEGIGRFYGPAGLPKEGVVAVFRLVACGP